MVNNLEETKKRVLDRFSTDYRDKYISIKGILFEEGGKLYVVAGSTGAEIINYHSLGETYKELLNVACEKGNDLIFNGKEIILGRPELIFGEFGIKLDSLSFNCPLWKYES
ncbi:MAG: hypothetical protein DRP06_01025 [Candidatus Aenigmatarchaeota archaeon]|nr:MAG: hypothetical protein DRP06_01025 [Candidatus Aenigmarchaeota archaeon]